MNHEHGDGPLDPISFERRRQAERIRTGEEAERERRRKALADQRRAERIRKAKIARIKALCLLAIVALGVLCAVIGIGVAIFKAIHNANSKDKLPPAPDNAVSAEETALIGAFSSFDGHLFTSEGSTSAAETAFFNAYNGMLRDITLSGGSAYNIPQSTVRMNELGELSRRFAPFSTTDAFTALKNAVRSAPVYSGGYVWTEAENIRSSETGGYLYDTNPSFISAVCNICLWEASSAFLSEVDPDTMPKLDASGGKTVQQKLELAVNYLLDGKTADGGLKYDPISGLAYIHTPANDGTSSGFGSNRFSNFRFGYLDAYTNTAFNRAMNDLAALYTLLGQPDKAGEYAAIAVRNASAFNERFWDAGKQRYIGCVDKNGASYDYGFVFLNLEAVEAGIATHDQASAIFAWLDGERQIDGDTARGSDIYAYGFAPRNTTVPAADTWWDYFGGKLPLSTEGSYNSYYPNGGVSLATAYYDILAREKSGDQTGAAKRLTALADAYASGTLASHADDKAYAIAGQARSGLAPMSVLYAVFGISTDGTHLCVSPDFSLLPADTAQTAAAVPAVSPARGIRGVGFGKNTYGFLFDADKVYLTAVSRSPVRIRLGGMEANADYLCIPVENGLERTPTSLHSNADGTLDIAAEFGSTSYLRIERAANETSAE